MLTRSIDLDDPFDLSIEEKIFHNAKRVCVVFAVAAVTISGLDLMNIRPLESAAEFVHRIATRAGRLARDDPRRHQRDFDQRAGAPSVVVAIPADRLAMESLPALSPPKVMAAPGLIARRSPSSPPRAMRTPCRSRWPRRRRSNRRRSPIWPSARRTWCARRAPWRRRKTAAAAAPPSRRRRRPPATDAARQPRSRRAARRGRAAAGGRSAFRCRRTSRCCRRARPAPPPSPAQRLHLEGKSRAKAEQLPRQGGLFRGARPALSRPGGGGAGGDEPRVLRHLSARRLRRDLSERQPLSRPASSPSPATAGAR